MANPNLQPPIIFQGIQMGLVAHRCTIERGLAGWRAMESPYLGRLCNDGSVGAVSVDAYLTQTLIKEAAVGSPVSPTRFQTIQLGMAEKACSNAHMKIQGFTAPPGSVPLDPLTLATLLVPLRMILKADQGTVWEFVGQPSIGVTFRCDFKGGEKLALIIDNTDPRSTISGQVFQFQLFLNCDPDYAIEMLRKGIRGND